MASPARFVATHLRCQILLQPCANVQLMRRLARWSSPNSGSCNAMAVPHSAKSVVRSHGLHSPHDVTWPASLGQVQSLRHGRRMCFFFQNSHLMEKTRNHSWNWILVTLLHDPHVGYVSRQWSNRQMKGEITEDCAVCPKGGVGLHRLLLDGDSAYTPEVFHIAPRKDDG